MTSDRSQWFVATPWLAEHLGEDGLSVVDASWHLPTAGRNAAAEFAEAHIPGAVFFDIDAIADRTSPLPHMLPAPDQFAAMVGALGIAETDTIVVYDSLGLYSAPRVWWSFKSMGAPNVRILDGGRPRWRQETRPLEGGLAPTRPKVFRPRFDPTATVDLAGLRSALAEGRVQVLDGRPAARFTGEAPEPRPGVRSGHMPGSVSLPGTDLVENGRMKDAPALARAFAAAGVDLGKPLVTSCGSGVVAAILTLAAEMVGAEKISLYDGSWTEWGSRDDTPVMSGSA